MHGCVAQMALTLSVRGLHTLEARRAVVIVVSGGGWEGHACDGPVSSQHRLTHRLRAKAGAEAV